jgi:ABC-type uncharacterized transport system substrate-binding protein
VVLSVVGGDGAPGDGLGYHRAMLSRRGFLGTVSAGLLAAPLVVEGQQAGKVPRIGVLMAGSRLDFRSHFGEGLRAHGYDEGRNIIIEWLAAGAENTRFDALAAELVAARVDIIVAVSTPAAIAAKKATSAIPIVFTAVGDPIGTGLVTSLPRPGGNITGVSQASSEGVNAKRLEILKQAAPKVSRLAVLWVETNASHRVGMPRMELAARALGIQIQSVSVRSAPDLVTALTTIRQKRADSIVVQPDALTLVQLPRIVEFATDNRLPSAYAGREFVEAGGLLSYGINFPESFRAAATYVAKILRGSKPADLPVEQATKFELVTNLKTAKALGLTIPPSLLLRADQVIE